MLGVVPVNELEEAHRSPETGSLTAAPEVKTLFSPIEAAPATLAGMPARSGLGSSQERQGALELPQEAPPLRAPLTDPKARTLMGFGTDFLIPNGKKNTDTGESPGRAAEATKAAFKGTLMGVSPFSAEHFPSPNDAVRAPPSPSATDLGATVNVNLPNSPDDYGDKYAGNRSQQYKTMLGVAPPLLTDDVPGNIPQDPVDHRAIPAPSLPQKGTLLGVAMPGIAPLNPGVKKSDAQPEPAALPLQDRHPTPRRTTPSIPPEHRQSAAMAALEAANRIAMQRALQRRRLAWILGIASALLAIIITVAVLIWWNSVRLTVKVGTADGNQEQLLISCSNCQAGTTIMLKGRTARFLSGKAELAVPGRLNVGLNRLPLEVKRPNRARSEVVIANVPVEFRVSADLAGLTKDVPQLLVLVEALPQTRIQIDGRVLNIGADGRLVVPIDVSQKLTGTSAALVPFEYDLAYVVSLKDGSSVPGNISARIGISPLEISAPGLDHVTPNATFTLAGRTSPKAKVTANGHPLVVAADGTFRQDMALSAPGATRLRVRTQAEGLAPRLVDISLERVTNLRQRAEELGRSLFTTHDAISNLLAESPNSRVALHGEVVAVEISGPTTTLIVSASCVRGPCLATVRHGAPLSFKRGDRIIAIGHGRLTKRATGPERDLSIDAGLVVEESQRDR